MANNILEHTNDYARIVLAGIRLFNGLAALAVPGVLARRLGVDPDSNAAALYVLRMFGIRTVLIGAQLLSRDDRLRTNALRVAPVIHAIDATAAVIAGIQRQLPARAAATAALISTTNTVLAVVAQPRKVEKGRSLWN